MSVHAECGQVTTFQDAATDVITTTLVVGDLEQWDAEGRVMPPVDGLQFVDLVRLNGNLIRKVEPDIIFSPLVCGSFDAWDVAGRLNDLQFRGKYRVVSDDIPDSDVIRAEIRVLAPELDFDLLLMPPLG